MKNKPKGTRNPGKIVDQHLGTKKDEFGAIGSNKGMVNPKSQYRFSRPNKRGNQK